MSRKRTSYADTTFAFAASIQKIAEDRRPAVTVESFRVEPTRLSSGSYDTLVVTFRIPRADEDKPEEPDTSDDPLEKILQDVEASMIEMEVKNHEV